MFHGLLCHNIYHALSKEHVVFYVVCVFHRAMSWSSYFVHYMMHYKVRFLSCGLSLFQFFLKAGPTFI
jgi:hypothetical protein